MTTQKQIEANKKNARKGGRPKGTRSIKRIAQERAIEVLKNKVLEEWEPLIETKIKLALGVYILKKVDGKIEHVYLEKPDSGSLEYLFSMVVGRPKENMNLRIKGIQELTESVRKILGGK